MEAIYWLAVLGCVYGFGHILLIMLGAVLVLKENKFSNRRAMLASLGGISGCFSHTIGDWQTWVGIVSLVVMLNI